MYKYRLKHALIYADQSLDHDNYKDIGSLNRVNTHDMSF